MRATRSRNFYLSCVATIALVTATPALGAPINITGADANAVNLLSPFLSLNTNAIGQQTLTSNLDNSVAINQFAGTSTVIEAISISDKAILNATSGAFTNITLPGGATRSYGPGANLGGGLPVQAVQSPGGIAPFQQYGGLGSLGAAYQNAVATTGATAPAAANLLADAYSFTSQDLGVLKNYFANGAATNPSTTPVGYVPTAAVAPAGYTLPVINGLPNTTNSVYDIAYGVTNTGANQDVYGDSRPVQVAPSRINGYDPTALSGLATNPSFPSGHTTYAFTDSMLIGMMAPNFYQSMLLRASEYGNSRIDLGVHYVLDIIASRSFVSYDLAQLLNRTDPAYQVTNTVNSTTAFNLNSEFVAGATQLTAYLNTQTGSCGGSQAACAANNPYLTYSAQTYASAPFVTNAGATTASQDAAIYRSRLTYGLPTLTYALAPREQAPTGGPDASILLATLYGGSSTQAQALAASVGGAIYGNLSTATINQVIVNTETNAIAAFYGTPLSYWSRINLYDAAAYFQNVTGNIALASTDQLKTNVTVGGGTPALDMPAGVLSGTGTIVGNVVFQSGGAFAAQGNGTSAFTPLQVSGTVALQAGSKVQLSGVFLPGTTYNLVNSTGAITIDPAATVDTSQSGNLTTLFTGKLAAAANSGLTVTLTSHFASVASTGNQIAFANSLDTAGNGGNLSANSTALLNALIVNNTAANAPAAYDSLAGEGLADQEQTAIEADDLFARTVLSHGVLPGKDSHAGRNGIWGAGFGQYASLDGDATQGSARLSGHTYGGVVGFDYDVAEDFTAGIAAGYSSSTDAVAARATTGRITAAHVALYGIKRIDEGYVAGTISYAHFDNSTNRFVSGLGTVTQEQASFSSNEWLGRIEAGYRLVASEVNVTPIGGFELASLSSDAFTETGIAGPVAGLAAQGRATDADRSFLGAQIDGSLMLGTDVAVTPFARLTWEHAFETARGLTSALQAFPGSSFTIYGASAAADAARVNAGARVAVASNVSLFAAFDGAFASHSNTYGGNGGLSITW